MATTGRSYHPSPLRQLLMSMHSWIVSGMVATRRRRKMIIVMVGIKAWALSSLSVAFRSSDPLLFSRPSQHPPLLLHPLLGHLLRLWAEQSGTAVGSPYILGPDIYLALYGTTQKLSGEKTKTALLRKVYVANDWSRELLIDVCMMYPLGRSYK